jgi:hypothetical protein
LRKDKQSPQIRLLEDACIPWYDSCKKEFSAVLNSKLFCKTREHIMDYKILGKQNDIALIVADEVVIKDTQSALDVIASAQYETDCDKLIIDKSCVTDKFFILSTGIAGEILQKFINYHKKIAIVGDYSRYTSKALRDFIYESNNGNSIYFLQSIEEAVLKLDRAE